GRRLLRGLGRAGNIDRGEHDHARRLDRLVARIEEIELIEGELERAHVAGEQLLGGPYVYGGDAVRGKPVAHELIKFLGHHVEGNVAAGEDVDDDDVVGLGMPVEEHAAVAFEEMQPAGFAHAEIFLGGGNDAGIDLDDVDRRLRNEAVEIDGNGAAAEPEHEHAPDLRRMDRGKAEGAGVEQRQVVGIGEIGLRLARVPALPLERHLEDVFELADENVVVDR